MPHPAPTPTPNASGLASLKDTFYRRYDTTIKRKQFFLGLLVAVMSVLILCQIYGMGYRDQDRVAGQYGEYCYPSDNVPKNVKYLRNFDTKAACEEFIQKNAPARAAEKSRRDAIRAANAAKPMSGQSISSPKAPAIGT